MSDCSGRCLAGTMIAIVFGALFLWTLVFAYQTHITNLNDYRVLLWYALALVYLAIAKIVKRWGMSCPHLGNCRITAPRKYRKRG